MGGKLVHVLLRAMWGKLYKAKNKAALNETKTLPEWNESMKLTDFEISLLLLLRSNTVNGNGVMKMKNMRLTSE
jgi:hypothetical protein